MFADYHVHTCYSDDSEYLMEDVVRDAISLGMNEICFTDHVDYGIKRDWDDPLGVIYRKGGPGEPGSVFPAGGSAGPRRRGAARVKPIAGRAELW